MKSLVCLIFGGTAIWINMRKSLRVVRGRKMSWDPGLLSQLIENVHHPKHMFYQCMIFVYLMFVNGFAQLNTFNHVHKNRAKKHN